VLRLGSVHKISYYVYRNIPKSEKNVKHFWSQAFQVNNSLYNKRILSHKTRQKKYTKRKPQVNISHKLTETSQGIICKPIPILSSGIYSRYVM
jgi:hypothetical protein